MHSEMHFGASDAPGDLSSDDLSDDNAGVKRARSNDQSHIVQTWTSRIHRDRRNRRVARGRIELWARVMTPQCVFSRLFRGVRSRSHTENTILLV